MHCRYCGQALAIAGAYCPSCGKATNRDLEISNCHSGNAAGPATGGTSGWTLTSFILGILGVTSCGLASLPGIAISIVDMNKRRRGLISRSTLSVWGLWLNITGVALMVLSGIALVAVLVLDGGGDGDRDPARAVTQEGAGPDVRESRPDGSVDGVYTEVLEDYWRAFSSSLKVTACQLHAQDAQVAAVAMIVALRADQGLEIRPADEGEWETAAQRFLAQKC